MNKISEWLSAWVNEWMNEQTKQRTFLNKLSYLSELSN